MVYIIALISIMLGAFAQYLLKVGVQQVIWYKDEGFYTLMSGLINMRLLSGILCYGLSLLFWLYVLSKIELSRAYPLVSLGYVFTLLLHVIKLLVYFLLWLEYILSPECDSLV